MTDEEISNLSTQLARMDQSLFNICGTQDRQEKALVDLFKGLREVSSKVSCLDTVVRMSTAEQTRINKELKADICELKEADKTMQDSLDGRMQGVERRLAYFAGGLAVLLVVFDLAVRYGLETIGG